MSTPADPGRTRSGRPGLLYRRARVRYALWRSVSRGHYQNRRHRSQTKYLHRLHAPGEWRTLPPAYFPGLPILRSEAAGARRQPDCAIPKRDAGSARRPIFGWWFLTLLC